jgi:hypothetical protein
MKSKLISLALIAISFVYIGCRKYDPSKIVSTAWNPNIAVPLAYAEFDVYDIMARTDSNDIVVIDPSSGAIALVYKGEVISYEAKDIVQLSDYTESISFSSSDVGLVTAASFNGSASGSTTSTVTAPVNAGVEMYTVLFKDGDLTINVQTDVQHDVDITITIPALLESGNVFTRTIPLAFGGLIPQVASINVDLTGMSLDLTQGNTTFNEFDIQTTVTITGTGNPVTGIESCTADLTFSSLAFQNATGYFGQQSVGVDNDSILIKIFENSSSGFFQLVDPRVRFTVQNSFGFPLEIDFANLQSIDVNTGTSYPLTGYPNPLSIPSPLSMGQTTTTVLELNSSNTTNISTVITPTPKYFYFEANGTSNPLGNIGANFITDTSTFKVDAELELPLEGYAYGFSFSDTIDFTFSENIDNIESLMIRLNVDNGFPVELLSQVTLLDSNGVPLFNLLNAPENVVESALVDGNGRVSQNIVKITDFILTETEIEQMPEVRSILVTAVAKSLNGNNGLIVKIYDDYFINVKVGMQVQGKFNL